MFHVEPFLHRGRLPVLPCFCKEEFTMLRLTIAALVACALLAPVSLLAQESRTTEIRSTEIRGVVKSMDQSKGTITVTTEGKDRTFDVAQNVQTVQLRTYRLRRPTYVTMTGMGSIPQGSSVRLVAQSRNNGQEIVTEVRPDNTTVSSGRRRLLFR
jgi:hypothetical protein